MVFRGIIRDILSIYLGYETLRAAFTKSFVISNYMLIAAIALLLLSVWFFLERIGIIPKME